MKRTQPGCPIEGCQRPTVRKRDGACEMHRKATAGHRVAPAERFWGYVDQSGGPEACWPWTGGKNSDGYGTFDFHRRSVGAHRYALIFSGTELAVEQEACHRCDVPSCCNPAHLFVGSHADNCRDMVTKGRHASLLRVACPTGHPYDERNTLISNEKRHCRACDKARQASTRGRTLATARQRRYRERRAAA